MNPLESDNKLVTYHSWFACPLLDLRANSHMCVWNGVALMMPSRYMHLDLFQHVIRNVSRFRLQTQTLAVEPSIWQKETANVTSVPVLLFKMRCMLFSTVKTCLCALSERSNCSFSSLSASPFLWRPLLFYMPCLVSSQTVLDFLSQRRNKPCHFISDIMDFSLAGEDQQQTKQPND